MMPDSIRSVWDSLSKPKKQDGYRAEQVVGTNCWVFKNYEGQLGFLMSGVQTPTRPPNLEHFEILERGEKEVHRNGEMYTLNRCLEIHLDPSCDAELLTMVLDRMKDHQPSGQYSTDLLMTVIQQVQHMFKKSKRPPRKEEVIGAWGELKFLQLCLSSTDNVSEKRRRLNGWEAEGDGRDIIDFRYPHFEEGVAIEAKTSTSGRVHHINGTDQVTVPEECGQGWLASILIRETDGSSGHSCAQLVDEIEKSFNGSEEETSDLLRIFHSKLDMRGICCYDERFYFIMPEGDLRLIDMRFVPKPRVSPEIKSIEWEVDVENVESEFDHPLISINDE